ncbi:MAG: XdhC family protein, partial [bacterium]
SHEVLIEAGWLAEAGQAFCLVIVIGTKGSTPRQAGAMMLVRADGSCVGTIGGGAVESASIEEGKAAILDGQARMRTYALDEKAEGVPTGSICGGQMEVFFAPTPARAVLYLFGGGHVGRATAAIAAEAGWQVEVFDERAEMAASERHPHATRVHTGNVVAQARELKLKPSDFVAIVTHRHDLDFAILKEILPKGAGYIGVIASRVKAAEFRKELTVAGFQAEDIERVHMPIGLAIHAQTPEEIAVAIVAEMIEIRRGSKKQVR